MKTSLVGPALGLDFGTTNSIAAIAAIADGKGKPELIRFDGPASNGPVFRSALCFWHDEDVRGGLAAEAGA
jgi:hypothetical chaperone protein